MQNIFLTFEKLCWHSFKQLICMGTIKNYTNTSWGILLPLVASPSWFQTWCKFACDSFTFSFQFCSPPCCRAGHINTWAGRAQSDPERSARVRRGWEKLCGRNCVNQKTKKGVEILLLSFSITPFPLVSFELGMSRYPKGIPGKRGLWLLTPP